METERKSFGLEGKANKDFIRDLGKLLEAPVSFLLDLPNYLKTQQGFTFKEEGEEQMRAAAVHLSIEPDDLSNVLSVLKFMFDSVLQQDLDLQLFLDEVDAFCTKRGIAGFPERRDALVALLTPTPDYLQRRAASPFANGVSPCAGSVSAVVQLRAIFKGKDKSELVGYVPMVQVRITAAFDTDDFQKQPYVFQLTSNELDDFMAILKQYQRQVADMKRSVGDSLRLYDPHDRRHKNGE